MKTFNSHIAPTSLEPRLSGPDGPYVRLENNRLELLCVNKSGNVVTESRSPKLNSIICWVDNTSEDSFVVSLQSSMHIEQLPSEYQAPRSIVVISDIEGNFDALSNLLISNEIINSCFEWIFKDNDLVILGDATDRGQNVTQCLWLIYHLEYQARMRGGNVHYVLGNHEIMNLLLDVRYVPDKYLALARRVSSVNDMKEAYRVLLEYNSVLVDWIKKKNCMEKIGNTLFVHAGISPEFFYRGLSIQQTNSILHQYLDNEYVDPVLAEAVIGGLGPLWYRGFVRSSARAASYEKVDETFIDQVLEFYGVNKIVIGHSLVDHVSSDYHGKVWRVDFLHAQERLSKKSEALLIEDENIFRINGAGKKRLLKKSRSKSVGSKTGVGRLNSLFNKHTK